jgi:glycine/D-amino acid oxidase-like deaminating enzyme/nitrite reductase/ring-hydroxylating ferredoxin subunit
MKKESIWIHNVNNIKLEKLSKNISCDILIIGGGMAGLSVAYDLMNSNKKVVLIEKDICGGGASSKNTGKLTWMQDLIYNRITKNYGSDMAKLYFDSQIDAINKVRKIVDDNKISCHLVKTKSYVFSYSGTDYADFSGEINFYKKYGIKYQLLDRLPVDYPCKYVLETYDSYVFNPYEYIVGLKNIVKDKISIYEDTRCLSIDKVKNEYVVSVQGNYKVNCKYVVVASHYPMFIVPFFVPFKTRVDHFFIGAALTNKNINVQLISYGKMSISMRFYRYKDNNYLLYGRRNHSVTSNLDMRQDYNELFNEYKKYFGESLEYFYHTHDLMTYDGIPFIGKIDDNLFICTGFNKWGNTNGVISGTLISDIINGIDNKYQVLFNPRRGLSMDKIKNLFLYNIDVGSRYVINKINCNKKYYGEDVSVEYINGKKCGIYISSDGVKHVVSNICPHMKCNLIFNYVDKTWDCPCHASRFDVDGNLIYGPSVFDIKVKNV